MITKAEVRAFVLSRLGPRTGTLIWDVGAGSGSVAVECARFGAAVIAVERDPSARIAANAARHGAHVQVVVGEAPGALDGLPHPDAVFIGGGGLGALAGVVQQAPRRIVSALATIERVSVTQRALAEAGYRVDGTVIQASRLAPLGEGTRLAATNPVFVVWGEK
jgi:precorrin-6Y C5,15-methyltransferase (decarboxylating)